MTIPKLAPRLRYLATILVLSVACTEPRRADRTTPSPLPTFDARIEFSDSLAAPGSEIVVTVRFVGAPIASATARLLYDTTVVQLVGEEPIADGATRVTNAQPGVVRFAGVAPGGFGEGRMFAGRFAVRRAVTASGLRLVVDEAHTTSRADVAASLSRKP